MSTPSEPRWRTATYDRSTYNKFTYDKPLAFGTPLRSMLTDAEYIVARTYDPNDIKENGTVLIAPAANPDQAFAICADRIEVSFHVIH